MQAMRELLASLSEQSLSSDRLLLVTAPVLSEHGSAALLWTQLSLPLLRFALSGQSRGPGVTTIAHLIGKEKTAARIQRALGEVLGA